MLEESFTGGIEIILMKVPARSPKIPGFMIQETLRTRNHKNVTTRREETVPGEETVNDKRDANNPVRAVIQRSQEWIYRKDVREDA